MEFDIKMEDGATYIIAEMSANHAGSFERAKEIIHAAKESGADGIKIQTYTADTITMNCNNKYFHINNGTWEGETLYHLYERAYTPWEWQEDLKAESEKIGIDFLSTPFDKTSVDFLENLDIKMYKIASFELVDIPLIDYVASKNKPIILSTGMGSIDEIEDAVDTIKKYHKNFTLLKCSSSYPAVSDEMNLITMADMKERFKCKVGLSDHSMGSLGAVVAVAMGANVIEKHFCMNREIKNPDSSFSMEPKEFADMVRDIRLVEKVKGKVFYGLMEQERSNINLRKSVFVSNDIKKGEEITEDNTRIIRPAYGLKPKYYNTVLGKRAKKDLKKGNPLKIDEVE